MKRWIIFVIGIFVLTLPCRAQIGKAVTVLAGTPEDKALVAIDAATDSKEKIALLDKFMAEFGTTDMVLQAYERYIAVYSADKNYDKVFEIGNRALAYDPENLQIAASLVRAAQEKADPARLGEWGARVSQIIQNFKAKPAPAGMNAEDWVSRKNFALTEAAGNLTFVEYAMFNTAMGLADPGQKGALLARLVDAFPESAYASDAATIAADSFRQAKDNAKMMEFAQKTLAKNPDHVGLLLLLAENWIDGRTQFDKAEEYAKRALDVLNTKAQKPAGVAEDQWQKQKGLQTGLANSSIGQVQVHLKRDAQAVDPLKAAAPFLKPYDFYYARNQYFLGLAYSNLKKTPDARAALTEVVALNTPFKTFAQEAIAKLATTPAAKAKKRG